MDKKRLTGAVSGSVAAGNPFTSYVIGGELLSNGTTTADIAQIPSGTVGQWTNSGGVTAASNAWAYETESPAGAGNLAGGYISAP